MSVYSSIRRDLQLVERFYEIQNAIEGIEGDFN